jgi:hypothetical protein
MKFCENSKLKKFRLKEGIPLAHRILSNGYNADGTHKEYDLCEITDTEAAELHKIGNSQVISVGKVEPTEPATLPPAKK